MGENPDPAAKTNGEQQQRQPALPLEYAIPPKKLPWWSVRVGGPWGIVILIILALLFASLIDFPTGAATQRANRVKCASNLKQIGMGLMLYANDNRGQFPPKFELLITNADLNPEVFVCPSSNDETAIGPTTQAMLAEFAKKEHCSYIYLGSGKTSAVPATYILAYEKPENHDGEGMNILYGDGTVSWVTKPEMTRLLSELQSGHNPPRPATQPSATGGRP